MKGLFDGVVSQYIDFNGKCRILNYANISVAISPLPPLNVPSVPKSKIITTTVQIAIDFATKHNLQITEQDGDEIEQIIQGVWVKDLVEPPRINFGYIPIDTKKDNGAIDDIPYSDQNSVDPIFVGAKSSLQTARDNAKIAEYLKEYSLYEWSRNPDTFGETNYVIDPNHKYDLSITHFDVVAARKGTFYKRGKLVVLDKDTMTRLILYVKVSFLNDSHLETQYKNKRTIVSPKFYQNITDFRADDNQFVFMNLASLNQWIASQKYGETNVVTSFTYPTNELPYYYRNILIKNGRLLLLQNTEGADFMSALVVSKYWVTTKVNAGYHTLSANLPIVVKGKPSFNVYTERGLVHRSDTKPTDSDPRLHVFEYNDGTFAAALFL